MPLPSEQLLLYFLSFWVPTCDLLSSFVRVADTQLKALCYIWEHSCWGCHCDACTCLHWPFSASWQPLQMLPPDRCPWGPPASLHPSADAVAFPHCSSSTTAVSSKKKTGCSWSASMGGERARASPWVLIPKLALLFPPASAPASDTAPLTWRVHGKSRKYRSASAFKMNQLTCSIVAQKLRWDVEYVQTLLCLSSVLSEKRQYCRLFGWAGALNSKCMYWHLLTPAPFLFNKPNGFHPLVGKE